MYPTTQLQFLYFTRTQTLPVVFKGQGQLILEKAQSMGESVGTSQLGFMADVQDELQVRALSAGLTKEGGDDVSSLPSTNKYAIPLSRAQLLRCALKRPTQQATSYKWPVLHTIYHSRPPRSARKGWGKNRGIGLQL